MTEPRKKFVCATCNSDNVRRDAFTAWNEDTQEWELAETFDAAHCNDCGGETTLKEVPL